MMTLMSCWRSCEDGKWEGIFGRRSARGRNPIIVTAIVSDTGCLRPCISYKRPVTLFMLQSSFGLLFKVVSSLVAFISPSRENVGCNFCRGRITDSMEIPASAKLLHSPSMLLSSHRYCNVASVLCRALCRYNTHLASRMNL